MQKCVYNVYIFKLSLYFAYHCWWLGMLRSCVCVCVGRVLLLLLLCQNMDKKRKNFISLPSLSHTFLSLSRFPSPSLCEIQRNRKTVKDFNMSLLFPIGRLERTTLKNVKKCSEKKEDSTQFLSDHFSRMDVVDL